MPRYDSIQQYSNSFFANCAHCSWQQLNCRTEASAKRIGKLHAKTCKGNTDVILPENVQLRTRQEFVDPRTSDQGKSIVETQKAYLM